PDEVRANFLELAARGLTCNPLSDGFGLEQLGNALGNCYAGLAVFVCVAGNARRVDRQCCLKQCSMKALAGFEKVGGNSHDATLKMRFTDSAAKICRATAAAAGGGKALPIWR